MYNTELRIKNNFNDLKEKFQMDTGKIWDENLDTYINYVNMKVNDWNSQINSHKLNIIVNNIGIYFEKIDELYKVLSK